MQTNKMVRLLFLVLCSCATVVTSSVVVKSSKVTCSSDLPSNPNNECTSYELPANHFDSEDSSTVHVVVSTYAPQGYTTLVQQAFIILGQGCLFSNADYIAQLTNFVQTLKAGVTISFVDPRGSGESGSLSCPDDSLNTSFIPSSACATWASENSVADYYSLQQMAADLQSILPLFKPGGATSSSISTYVLAGDFIGEMWLQAWGKMYNPSPTTTPGLQFVVRNTPADLASYDFWRAMVSNPDSIVRETLDQCTADVNCMKAFGGISDMNELLSSTMLAAREERLQCSDLLSAAWKESMGTKPYPFFRFYSEVLSMLVMHPFDPMNASWQSGNYPTLVPTVVFRISRCNPSDVQNLLTLYQKLISLTKKPASQSVCIPSPVLKHNLYFNDLSQGPPSGIVQLLNSGNRQRIVPTPNFFSQLYEAYSQWPKREVNESMKTAPFSTALNSRYFLAGLNPMTNFAQQFAGLGGIRITEGTNTLYQPAAVNALFSSAALSGGDKFGCALSKVWSIAVKNHSTYIWCQEQPLSTKLLWFTDVALNTLLFPLNSTDIVDIPGGYTSCTSCGVPVPSTAAADGLDFHTTTPLPPGQTWATPLPPGDTLPPEESGPHDDFRITGTEVRVNLVGLVFGLLLAAIVFGIVVVCAYKCIKRRILNDPEKRDFFKSVYGDQSGSIQNPTQNQNQNIYKSI